MLSQYTRETKDKVKAGNFETVHCHKSPSHYYAESRAQPNVARLTIPFLNQCLCMRSPNSILTSHRSRLVNAVAVAGTISGLTFQWRVSERMAAVVVTYKHYTELEITSSWILKSISSFRLKKYPNLMFCSFTSVREAERTVG